MRKGHIEALFGFAGLACALAVHVDAVGTAVQNRCSQLDQLAHHWFERYLLLECDHGP